MRFDLLSLPVLLSVPACMVKVKQDAKEQCALLTDLLPEL
jgi:hypothetical protein